LAKQPNAFREQDGQALFAPGPGRDPHPEYRWRRRAPREHRDRNIRAVWREAEPVETDWEGTTYGRYHDETGMMLLAEFGFITTVVRVAEADRDTTHDIIDDHREGSTDD